MQISAEEALKFAAAFQAAWEELVKDGRVTMSNIDRLPALLVGAVLETAGHHQDAVTWGNAALLRLMAHRPELEALGVKLSDEK